MSPPVCCERNDDGPDYLRMILTSRVYDVCKETPCSLAVGMSSRLNAQVYFKREDLQPVFSFKLRGAYNMMAQLSEDDRWKGVISVSAGNHAQGVAYSAEKLGMPATIVMPTATPSIKSDNVRRLGANVILHGENFDEAKAEGLRLEKEHGLKYIPPFDDPYVIAGQGTIGLEILRQIDVQSLKAVFVAVGGGGLIAGVGAYIKRIAPHVKVIGVETFDADAMYRSLKSGKLEVLEDVGLFADGTAVRSVGIETFRVSQQCVDEVIRVNTDELCAAIGAAFKETRVVMEPSGALSVAGLEKWLMEHEGEYTEEDKFCAVLSGANMDFDRLRFVSERSKLGAGREVFFVVQMRDQPGEFKKLIDLLSPRAITEFSYRYKSATAAHVYCSFTCQNRQEIPGLMQSIAEIGQTAYDVSDNDLAKTHARYLVGGSPSLESERIFRFRFPERPGALQRFLDALPDNHNVSLFHYRNYGSDVGSILAGIVAPANEASEVDESLKKTGYWYEEETDNLAYKLFLK